VHLPYRANAHFRDKKLSNRRYQTPTFEMKRKHNLEDGNAAIAVASQSATDTDTSFLSLGLDARLLQGIAKLGFANPTLVQAKAIPLALEGKDILGTL
jgi:superfamily II DNA/RNA helicase